MKHIIKYAMIGLVIVFTIPFHSCKFLNVNDYFDETLKYDSIFHTKLNLERYLWGTAALFPDEGDMFSSLGSFACDEGFSLTGDFNGMQYTLGNVTPTNSSGMDKWNNMYIVIRKVNTLLANIDQAVDLSTLDKRADLGYAYFMRAYAYYQLLMQYGPLVILGDDVLETNEQTEYYDRARETFDNSVDYVCNELERSATYMPSTIPIGYFGRPTPGAALGLIARLRLVQASPLWNGGDAARRTFGSWTRSTDGVNYVSQTPDEKKWATAAMACKRIIDMNVYSLYTVPKMPDTYPLPATVSNLPFPDGAGDIDPFRSYSDMFTGEALAVRNPEFLWAQMSPGTTLFTKFSFPIINMGGWNSICVTQKVIDAYRMADGHTIDDSSPDYPYTIKGSIGGPNKTFSGYQLQNSASKMYANREMRFYASIGFCEGFWPCNSTSDNTKRNQVVTYYADGNAGKQATDNNPDNYPITGYTLKKFVHVDDAWEGDGAQVLIKYYPMIRYAEILLSYVEALNNLTSTYTLQDEAGNTYTLSRNTDEMKKYFNMVRFRAGLPGLTDAEVASVTTMQSLIERERMVEFVFENRRFYDVRRWGEYETSESTPIMGMNTSATKASGGYYSVVPVDNAKARNRVVDKKLILFPINLDEVRKSPSMDQNPGYQN